MGSRLNCSTQHPRGIPKRAIAKRIVTATAIVGDSVGPTEYSWRARPKSPPDYLRRASTSDRSRFFLFMGALGENLTTRGNRIVRGLRVVSTLQSRWNSILRLTKVRAPARRFNVYPGIQAAIYDPEVKVAIRARHLGPRRLSGGVLNRWRDSIHRYNHVGGQVV